MERNEKRERKYTQGECIGEGAFGIVYKAKEKTTLKEVAIKTFKKINDDGLSLGICREIALLKELKHENIVKLKDVIISPKSLDMVIEYAEYDLVSIIKDHRNPPMHKGSIPLPDKTIKAIMYQILCGIDYLHQNWIIHRDLKPANILVVSDGKIKITDFGLARIFQAPLKSLSENGQVVTIWYRAPELLLGAKHYTTAIDIWAIGCIFAELIMLNPLFPGSEKFEDDQIKKIYEVHGIMDSSRWSECVYLPHFKRIMEKKVHGEWLNEKNRLSERSSLRDRFKQKLSPDGLDLLCSLLEYNPEKRITAKEALHHKYFETKSDLRGSIFFKATNGYSRRSAIIPKANNRKDLPDKNDKMKK